MNRLVWPDIAKGICIILIVFAHTGHGIESAQIPSNRLFKEVYFVTSYLFMVPVFFFLSGYFNTSPSTSTLKKVKTIGDRLLYPYILWTCIQAALLILSGQSNSSLNWLKIPDLLFDGFMQFWFLNVLIQISLLNLIFEKLKINRIYTLILALILLITTRMGYELPWIFHRLGHNLIYFELGLFVFTQKGFMEEVFKTRTLWISGFILFICVYLGVTIIHPLRVCAAIAGIILTISLANKLASKSLFSKSLSFLGQYSLQIYILHIIFAAGLRVFLMKMGVTNFSIHLLLGSFVGIVLPVIVGLIDKRYNLRMFRLKLAS